MSPPFGTHHGRNSECSAPLTRDCHTLQYPTQPLPHFPSQELRQVQSKWLQMTETGFGAKGSCKWKDQE